MLFRQEDHYVENDMHYEIYACQAQEGEYLLNVIHDGSMAIGLEDSIVIELDVKLTCSDEVIPLGLDDFDGDSSRHLTFGAYEDIHGYTMQLVSPGDSQLFPSLVMTFKTFCSSVHWLCTVCHEIGEGDDVPASHGFGKCDI